MRKQKGFTLIEIVVVLAIIAAIAAFLTPMLFDYLKESKVSRAKADVRNIAAAIANFNRDLQVYPIYNTSTAADSVTVLVLRTSGGNAAVASGVGDWITVTGTAVQTLDNALQLGLLANGTAKYADAVKKPGEWKGPYMTDFKADPWGNQYYVSTEGLHPGSAKASFVLSAGPNGVIETTMPQTVGGGTAFITGGDDVLYRIK